MGTICRGTIIAIAFVLSSGFALAQSVCKSSFQAKNYATALLECQRLSERGGLGGFTGTTALATLYQQGLGVTQDKAKALRLLKKAREQFLSHLRDNLNKVIFVPANSRTLEMSDFLDLRDRFPGKRVRITLAERSMLLTGTVASEEDKIQILRALVAKLPALAPSLAVAQIFNELVVGPDSAVNSDIDDLLTLEMLYLSFLDRVDLSDYFRDNHPTVVVKNGSVYLLGRVTTKVANVLTETARGVRSVKRVVRVFDIVSEAEASTSKRDVMPDVLAARDHSNSVYVAERDRAEEVKRQDSDAVRFKAEAVVAKKRQRELEDQLRQIQRAQDRSPPPVVQKIDSTGSGFRVARGVIVTNHHVIDGCKRLLVNDEPAQVSGRDASSDLALLSVNIAGPSVALRAQRVGVGEPVAVAGYPLRSLLSGFNMTMGNLSSMSGIGGDTSFLQITAPVQPGNSGGPMLDSAGNLIGVVVAKLDAIKMAKMTGDIPQNVNFAITVNALRSFLDANSVDYASVRSGSAILPTVIADRAKGFTVLVECWK